MSLSLGLSWAACDGKGDTKTDERSIVADQPKLDVWTVPPAGTEVASYTKQVKEDRLNDSRFEVRVFTMEHTAERSEFEVAYTYGASGNSSVKLFPRWYEDNVVKPVIKPVDSMDYAAMIGFDPGDGSFRELYLLQYKDAQLRLTRTRAYNKSAPNKAK